MCLLLPTLGWMVGGRVCVRATTNAVRFLRVVDFFYCRARRIARIANCSATHPESERGRKQPARSAARGWLRRRRRRSPPPPPPGNRSVTSEAKAGGSHSSASPCLARGVTVNYSSQLSALIVTSLSSLHFL